MGIKLLNKLKIKARKIKNIFSKLKDNLLEQIYKIDIIQKPFPKQPFGNKPHSNKENYLKIHKSAISNINSKVKYFEEEMGYFIDDEWFENLSLITQLVLKQIKLQSRKNTICISF